MASIYGFHPCDCWMYLVSAILHTSSKRAVMVDWSMQRSSYPKFCRNNSGATTIRSFDQESIFQDVNMKLTDACSRPSFYNSAAMQWLFFRMDMFNSITFAFCLSLCLFSRKN